MDASQIIIYGSGVCLAIYALLWYSNPLRAIPTLGGSDAPLLSYLTARKFARNGRSMLNEGYRKFYGTAFKVPLWDHWLVVLAGPKVTDEVRRRSDEEVSFIEGAGDIIQMKYTVGVYHEETHLNVEVIRDKLTRSIPAIFPAIMDELKVAIEEHIPAKEDEWVSVHVRPALQQVIARASSRVFVGLPLCRNQTYLNVAIKYALDLFADKNILNRYPVFLKPLVGMIINKGKEAVRVASEHLGPLIEERMTKMEQYGDSWEDKPNDLLQWYLEHPELDKSLPRIARRILGINLAAIHTSSNSITHALYHLAASPEYQQPLRKEVERLVGTEGWSKATMGKMWKLDSFLRESQRYNGIGLTSMTRKILKDIILSDGTRLPRGTLVVSASDSAHHDEANYADPDVFDGFRFARMREGDGEDTKHQFVHTSLDYMAFGHGRHACPGRFFAANELKAMLAYIVLNYDLKIGGDGKRPANIYYANGVIPAVNGRVLFRKRRDGPV